MNTLRLSACVAVLLTSTLTFAQNDPLSGLGQLITSGRTQEAREKILNARDAYIAQKNLSGEAATWLLMGLADTSASDAESARANLRRAEETFLAAGDHFGAWMSVWTLAEVEKGVGRYDDALAAHERALGLLRDAADPGSKFTVETLTILGPAFGAPAGMLGPLAEFPQLIKPLLLQFASVVTHDAYASLLIESGRELEKAEKLLQQAAADAVLFGGFFDFQIASHLGDLYRLRWRLDDARQSYLKAMESAKKIPNLFGQAASWELEMLGKLADLEMLSGRVGEALEWNQRALTIVRNEKNQEREARLLQHRADLMQNAGRHGEALALFDEALKLSIASGTEMWRQASIHHDIGLLHMFQGRYGSAAKQLEKAIAMYQAAGEPLLESTAWMLLAEVHSLLAVEEGAAEAAENARTLAKKSGFKPAETIANLIAAMSKHRAGTPEHPEFRAALQAWLAMPDSIPLLLNPELLTMFGESLGQVPGLPASGKNAPPPMPAFRWMPLLAKAKVLILRGDNAGARVALEEALKLDPGRDLRAGMLAMIGATYWREGGRDAAIRSFKDAATALDFSAEDLRVEEMLSGYLGSERRFYYEILIEMLVHEGKPWEAFAHAERARARAFLQLIGNHRLSAGHGADARLVREAEILRTQIMEMERNLHRAQGIEAERLATDLRNARDRYKTLMLRVKASNPEYASLTTVEPLDLAAIRKDLPADATLITYFVSPNLVHAWLVDSNQTQYTQLPLDKGRLRRIVCWAGQFGPRTDARGVALPNTGQAATGGEAYDALISPLAKFIKTQKLILVPHGELHYVPFAALHNRETNRYLVDDYTLTYAPSASALRFLKEKETPVDGAALILGNPTTPLPLRALPGAAEEATSIAHLLGSTAHLGEDAQESLLYGLGGKVDLIHLAAHGIYDSTSPLFSRVALAAGDDHDGSLTVDEILSSLDLGGVNLVVLSACQTAAGARSGGDEVMGLTRALLYAGTPGVLSTLWNIDDLASSVLMNEFYKRLAAGAPAADALRQAQLATKENARFSHPRYWAAFTLNGDPRGRWKSGSR